MILLDSLYINNSGGKVLLDYLVAELEQSKRDVFYLFDSRCYNDYKYLPLKHKLFLNSSVIKRHKFYKENSHKFTSVFCFGNLPPTLKLEIPVYTYFHNVSLLETPYNYGSRERLMKYIKRKFIERMSKNTDFYLVQSSFVKELVCNKLKVDDAKCIILPFFKKLNEGKNNNYKKKRNSFLYVSNGNTHKNHENLLTAWEQIALQGLYPELHLTVTPHFIPLVNKINHLIGKGLKIVNHGFVNPIDLYKESEFIVYPSLIESFGLGLIEGIEFGCDVIASEKEYVYEVIKPSLVFNPEDPSSIATSIIELLTDRKYPKSEVVVKNKIKELIEILSYETNNTRP